MDLLAPEIVLTFGAVLLVVAFLYAKVLDRIKDNTTVWEQTPLMGLAQDGELRAYKHEGFWQPMDTLRDKNLLEDYWSNKIAPWKLW